MKIIICTLIALVAFAMNSLLCRLALGGSGIDAASFTTIRLVSGALILIFVTTISRKTLFQKSNVNWLSAVLLFLYAAAFSFAYINLTTGTGALILFGSVQATMLTAALLSGERPHLLEWLGLTLALFGLIYLVFPGLAAPPLLSSALMIMAGVSWGFYSLRGRGASDPLINTSINFICALPFAAGINLIVFRSAHFSANGVLLAILSGAFASGLGYVVWYTALRGLTATRAATVQLSVPILAAVMGVIFLAEEVTVRLLFAAVMILGGVGLALAGKQYFTRLNNRKIISGKS